MDDQKPTDEKPGSGLVRFCLAGLSIVGVGSAMASIGSLSEEQLVGGGIFAIASALSFGLLLNALVRK